MIVKKSVWYETFYDLYSFAKAAFRKWHLIVGLLLLKTIQIYAKKVLIRDIT